MFFGCSKLELGWINMIMVLSVVFLDLVVVRSRSYLELGAGEYCRCSVETMERGGHGTSCDTTCILV
jgi:hypothetical protein